MPKRNRLRCTIVAGFRLQLLPQQPSLRLYECGAAERVETGAFRLHLDEQTSGVLA